MRPTSGCMQEPALVMFQELLEHADQMLPDSWTPLFFARRPIGSCNLVLFVHHRLMRSEKSVQNSRIGAKPFVHCET